MLNIIFLVLGVISLLLPFYGFEVSHFFFVNLGMLLIFDSFYGFCYQKQNIVTHYKNLIVMFFLSIGFWEIFSSFAMYLNLWKNIARGPMLLGPFQSYIAHGLIIPTVFVMLKALFPKVSKLDVRKFPWGIELIIGIIIFLLSLISAPFKVFVWLGIFLILDSICYQQTEIGMIAFCKKGLWRPFFSIILVALILGFFWEGYNMLSTQWTYTFKMFNFYPIFKMPILGYLGYIPMIGSVFNFYLIMEDLVLTSDEALAR